MVIDKTSFSLYYSKIRRNYLKKIIVIGAGMGGLSAAIRLQHAGYQVEIYEKEKISGGKMHPIHEDG